MADSSWAISARWAVSSALAGDLLRLEAAGGGLVVLAAGVGELGREVALRRLEGGDASDGLLPLCVERGELRLEFAAVGLGGLGADSAF